MKSSTLLTVLNRLFSPANLPNIALWLDASDASTITHTANAVSQWNDKSGLANHATQGTGGLQPTTNTTTINGLNTIDWDGAGNQMSLTSGISSTAFTAFTVYQIGTTSGTRTLVGGLTNAAVFGTVGNQQAITKAGVAQTALGAATLVVNTPYIYTGLTGAAGSTLYRGGVLETTNATAQTYATATTTIGGRGVSYLQGRIAEIIVCTGTLSTGNLNATGGYLGAKWGVKWTNI